MIELVCRDSVAVGDMLRLEDLVVNALVQAKEDTIALTVIRSTLGDTLMKQILQQVLGRCFPPHPGKAALSLLNSIGLIEGEHFTRYMLAPAMPH